MLQVLTTAQVLYTASSLQQIVLLYLKNQISFHFDVINFNNRFQKQQYK